MTHKQTKFSLSARHFPRKPYVQPIVSSNDNDDDAEVWQSFVVSTGRQCALSAAATVPTSPTKNKNWWTLKSWGLPGWCNLTRPYNILILLNKSGHDFCFKVKTWLPHLPLGFVKFIHWHRIRDEKKYERCLKKQSLSLVSIGIQWILFIHMKASIFFDNLFNENFLSCSVVRADQAEIGQLWNGLHRNI